MHAYQIVAGFSEIKSELRNKTNINKVLSDLQLWFSYEVDVLYAHDHADHLKCIALALYKRPEGTWAISFTGGAYGKQLVAHVINKFGAKSSAYEFNNLFQLYGYIAFR